MQPFTSALLAAGVAVAVSWIIAQSSQSSQPTHKPDDAPPPPFRPLVHFAAYAAAFYVLFWFISEAGDDACEAMKAIRTGEPDF
jgi:hypothetical protein